METSKSSGKLKKPRRKRIYVHLINDNVNDVEYVVKCLMTVCGQNYYQAHQCALITHNTGNSIVDSGFHPEIIYVYLSLMKCGLKVDMSTNKKCKK